MEKFSQKWAPALTAIALFLIAGLMLWGLLVQADAQADDVQEMLVTDTTFTSLAVTSGLTVDSGGLTVTAGGATVTAGGLTLSDGDLAVADDLVLTAQTEISVTNGAAFAPTGSYQPIAAAGEVTPTITVPAAGTVFTIVNTEAQTINLADSGTAKLSAAFAMGQYDSLTLISDGTNVIEIARSNN